MQGLLTGTRQAWQLGYRQVMAFLDSQAAIQLFNQTGNVTHNHRAKVLVFHELLSRE
ncbi:hypothetical protein LINGRAHAP2_LOCUS16813 [Linum grandiflorum]